MTVHRLFQDLQERIDEEIAKRLAQSDRGVHRSLQRGVTWTYLTTDRHFGSSTDRLLRGLLRRRFLCCR